MNAKGKSFSGLWMERTPAGVPRWRVRCGGGRGRKITLLVSPDHPDFEEHYKAAREGEPLRGRNPFKMPRPPARKISYMLSKARGRALKKGKAFTLDAAWISEVFDKQRGRCALSGMRMAFGEAEGKSPLAPSIDRIDVSEGYTRDNCRLVCVIVNLARLDWSDEDFIKMCKAVAEAN